MSNQLLKRVGKEIFIGAEIEEMRETRAKQEIERAEWQELLKQGWKLDSDGNKYKAEDL